MKSGSMLEHGKSLQGDITLPGDKSISHRAIMLGALAEGITCIKGLLECDDSNFTIQAFKAMGVQIESIDEYTVVQGRGLTGLKRPADPIFVGSSGTTMRILAGILAAQKFETVLTGDRGLSARPMHRIIEPLSLMGSFIMGSRDGYPPLRIMGGKLRAIDYELPVPSAQVKSAILFAGLYVKGITKVTEKIKSRDHTERMMRYFGADIRTKGLKVMLSGGKELKARAIAVPGDISSASFFMAGACLVKGSKLKIRNVNINPTRAGIIDAMSRMGAHIEVVNKKDLFEPVGDIIVEYGRTNGITIEEAEIPSMIDELPILFVLASLSSGRTVIKGVKELKVKETDRIESMVYNLSRMGANIRVKGEDIVIEGAEGLKGAAFKSFGDHRTCMAMAIAALSAKEDSVIDDVDCVTKSFPEFFGVLEKIKK
jgi:3-phosphoshikimate 1-carboxyvinyltransferase